MKFHLFIALILGLFLHRAGAQTGSVLKPSDNVIIELKTPVEDATTVSATYPVSQGGTVRLPMLNSEVRAAGLTTTQLARSIEAAYRAADIYTNPAIVCNIDFNKAAGGAAHIVAVGGEVRSPQGAVPLRDGMRLYQAIMQCGGPTEFADMRKVKIIRGTREYRFDMRKILPDGTNNPILQDGDTIHIPMD